MSQESIHGRESEAIDFLASRDGIRLRHGFWRSATGHVRGTILILGGRSEFIEKYYELIDELNLRGFDVRIFDWRGQGLSDRMLADPHKCYIQSYDQHIDDLDWILHRIVYPHLQEPLIVLAHSMGAHVLLRYLDSRPHHVTGAILTAPMIAIRTTPLPSTWVRWLARAMVRRGHAHLTVPAIRRHNPFMVGFQGNRLTSDSGRFFRTRQWMVQNHQLVAADVTYGWLEATFNSIAVIHRPGFGRRIDIPMRTMVAGRDRVVSNPAIMRLMRRWPDNLLIRMDDAQHEILQERDDIRTLFWKHFDGFGEALGLR